MIIFDIVVAIAPVAGYVSQLQLIRQEKSVGSFSIYVTAILLISAILRVFFWFTTGYAINLLFQAIFIIVIQVLQPPFRPCCLTNALSYLPLTNHSHSGNGILLTLMVQIMLSSPLFARLDCHRDRAHCHL